MRYIEGFKYMLKYGSLWSHVKDCFYYNKIYIFPLNFLEKEYRYFGPSFDWYDGPMYSFGFWWFNVSSAPEYVAKKKVPNSINFITESKFGYWKRRLMFIFFKR